MQPMFAQFDETPPAPLDDAMIEAIAQFSFDGEPTERSFAQRLARDNCWTSAYTERVITEYRRFVVLAVGAGHPVSPSEQVDQAWHLHLTFTHSYWEDLCLGVLRQPLHHNPTKGGAQEREKFRDWYSRTLESYVRLFDEPPPKDIWPDVETRFDQNAYVTRIDRIRNWVIPKPGRASIPMSRRHFVVVALALMVLSSAFPVLRSLSTPVPAEFLGATTQLTAVDFDSTMFVILLVLTCAAAVFFHARCPKCRRRNALTKTGRRQSRGRWNRVYEEWACRHCGHHVWKAEPSDDACG